MTRRSSKSGKERDPDYAVGYKRPPLHSRFKSGVSGNPSGYSKELRSIKKEMQSVFLKHITVRAGNRRRRVPAIVLLLQTILNTGLKGDGKAALAAWKLAEELDVFNVADTREVDFSALTPEENELVNRAFKLARKVTVTHRYDGR